jgi:hypothetical protein
MRTVITVWRGRGQGSGRPAQTQASRWVPSRLNSGAQQAAPRMTGWRRRLRNGDQMALAARNVVTRTIRNPLILRVNGVFADHNQSSTLPPYGGFCGKVYRSGTKTEPTLPLAPSKSAIRSDSTPGIRSMRLRYANPSTCVRSASSSVKSSGTSSVKSWRTRPSAVRCANRTSN